MDHKEKKDKIEIGEELKELPDDLAILIKELLDDKNYPENHNSRILLVNKGKSILPHLSKLLKSENKILRIEVAKIIELIADRRSIKTFIQLLDDPEFEVRWIAAEGLIKIGRSTIIPLLKLVRDGGGNYYVNRGVHHILTNLLYENEKKKISGFLRSLEDYHELGEIAPVEASKALLTLFK
jgi:HEAT repeat protein